MSDANGGGPQRNSLVLGWTFQTAYVLAHRAMLAAGNKRRGPDVTPCRHLSLMGTFDAYEGWSTIDFVPRKSLWGTWVWAMLGLQQT